MSNTERPQAGNVPRRAFLKGSGLALAAAAIPVTATAETTLDPVVGAKGEDASPGAAGRPNVLQGTESSFLFSRGNTLPIAARPFGMAHWTLQSADGTPWMFEPWARRLQGFRSTHQLSPWLSDYGQATFLPIAGNPNPDPRPRSTSWRPEKAKLTPSALRVDLMRYQIDAELIATERGALIHAEYRGSEAPGFLMEAPGKVEFTPDPSKRTVRFVSRANEGGVQPDFGTYYVVEFDQPWEKVENHENSRESAVVLRFSQGVKQVSARIASSFISAEQAARNLQLELGSKSPDALRREGEQHWEQYTRRLEVEGGTQRQRDTFASCLYRALLFPRTWHEPDENGKPHHMSPYDGKVHEGVMYADHGYWDVYRAWYPFMSIVYPEKLGEILQAWVNAYHEGGWLPQFPCPGYRACMTGSLIDSVFGEAAAKGIQGFDMAAAYEGLHKHATQAGDPDKGWGRRGIEEYLRMGYLPADKVDQSVAETADAAYGDFCIAQVAKALGRQADEQMFMERSHNWQKLYDAQTGFLRGKNTDGSWLTPFDPIQWGSPYVEGSAWQHRWDVPHDIEGLIARMGGPERAVDALDKMLNQPPDFHVGVYGAEIHEMSEMAAVDFGQYAHSNQPSHHLLYIFAVAGRPDRTQHWVRRVLNELYSPESFAGDEDTGSMSAWYLLSAMGFYSLCPAKPEYVLGAPLFSKMKVHLANGKTVQIDARGQSDNAMYAGQITIDGRRHDSVILPHATLMNGAHIEFSMQEQAPAAKRKTT